MLTPAVVAREGLDAVPVLIRRSRPGQKEGGFAHHSRESGGSERESAAVGRLHQQVLIHSESAPAEGMAPYQSFRRNPRTESADPEAATPLFAVMQKRKHVVVAEAIPPPEEVEFDGEAEARNLAPELLDELDACFHRAAGGEQVIHQDHPLARLDRILMNLE